MNTAAESVLNRISRASIVLSILLIIFGILALALPMVTSVGVVLFLAWLILFNGLTQLVHAFQSKGIGHIAWKLLVAALYLFAGAYLIGHPALGVAGLTLALGAFFLAEGVVDIVSYFSTRKQGASTWMLLDGVITLFLGLMIWKQWPSSSLWVIGTLLGISMLMTGITRLMMALSIRKLARA
jgi:uncharacterized membrane protein HdeD (DUF308 family)